MTSLNERLGYPPDAKLLILHDDDVGLAHSVNAAFLEAIQAGPLNSFSVMVPCPWFPEIAATVRENPDLDVGLHLTLTSDNRLCRYGPVLPWDRVPSLIDRDGYFWETEMEAAEHARPEEVEAELRAQIARAHQFGLRPTHLDSHMGTLYETEGLFDIFLKILREVRLPGGLVRSWWKTADYLQTALVETDLVIDRLVSIPPGIDPRDWTNYYLQVIEELKPGVTELVFHLGHDDDELRAAAGREVDWGAQWRQRDLDVLLSPTFAEALAQSGVRLLTWREIAAADQRGR
jgi:chitin disaccharide deacetylase